MTEALPNVYDALRAVAGLSAAPGTILPRPSLTDPTFVYAYENSYGTLYRWLLDKLGFRGLRQLDRGECGALGRHLATRHDRNRTSRFSNEAAVLGNPLLVHCPPARRLIEDWFPEAADCVFASDGLLYHSADLVPSGPDQQVGAGFPLGDSEPADRIGESAPPHLFRGQLQVLPPLALFVRCLIDRRIEAAAERRRIEWDIDPEILAPTKPSLLAIVVEAIERAALLCERKPERTDRTLVPTPYNLLWYHGPWDPEMVIQLCSEIAESGLMFGVGGWGSQEQVAILFSLLTHDAYPVPVPGASGFVTDFVPNPLVSTTTDISRALLYASDYFRTFPDKFDVDWDRVEKRVEAGEGFVYLVRIPSEGARQRRVVPISRMAAFLPKEYRSIGLLESEYGVPAWIPPSEIVGIKRASDVLRRLKQVGLWRLVTRGPQTVPTDEIVRMAFD